MSDGWARVPFEQAVDFREGPGIMAVDFHPAGVPLVRLAGLTPGASLLTKCNYLDPEKVDRKWDHFRLEAGDVLLSTSASLGRVAVVDAEAVGAIPYTGIIRMRPQDDSLLAEFIPWMLRGPDFAQQVEMAGVGSVMSHFGPSHLRRMSLNIPPLHAQRRIAAVLGAFDQLIETSVALATLAQQQAQSVCASAVSEVALRELTSALTPSQVKPVGPVEHYSLPAFDDGQMPEHIDGSAIKSGKFPVREPVVLVARLNPKWERCWMAYPGQNAMASTEFVLLTGRDLPVEAVWAAVSRAPFWEQMRSQVTGTTGSHQRVNKAAVLDLAVPDLRTLDGLSLYSITSLVQSAEALRAEAADLTRTRDELLPLLMSGRVRVEDVEGAL